MYRSKAIPGWHLIDNKMIHTDSEMEATIIRQLVKNGFAGKWRRMRRGIAYGYSKSTPDLELCILHDGMNRRALVELKALSAAEFTTADRERMRAAARFYGDAICLLYVKKTRQWHFIEPHGKLTKMDAPTPGGIAIDELPRPVTVIPFWNRYGRAYVSRPGIFILNKAMDEIEYVAKGLFGKPKKRRR